MASGRIGAAFVFVPLLLGISFLYLTDQQASTPVAVILMLMCGPFCWSALTVPVSVRFHDGVSVRYLLWHRRYSKAEITQIRFSKMSTQFGPGLLIPGWEFGSKTYQVGLIDLSNGKSITMKVNSDQAQFLDEWFQQSAA